MNFPLSYDDILKQIDAINPLEYAKTRNYTTGAISYLSPYISRGVISTQQVLQRLLERGFTIEESEKLIQQLAWREYFQRAWQQLEDDMFEDIRHRSTGIKHKNMPLAIAEASTGVNAIDAAIRQLYDCGYSHNHLRMYMASVTCNIGKACWKLPSQWMYYHLLDGDLASNSCSWQWVSGHFSTKQYYCNQENINKFTNSIQYQTFLDKSYEELLLLTVPEVMEKTTVLKLTTTLPLKKIPVVDTSLPLVIYTSYNLDPLWKKNVKANRILLLEPSHFEQFPVSDKVIDFIMGLAKNIDGLQVFVGEVNEIPHLNKLPAIYSKEHPAFKHFPGVKEERDWLFPEVKGFYKSFFSYWKKCLPYLKVKEGKRSGLVRA